MTQNDRCADVGADLVGFARGGLSPLASERVAVHIRRCAACRVVVEGFERGRASIREAPAATDDELALLHQRVLATLPLAREKARERQAAIAWDDAEDSLSRAMVRTRRRPHVVAGIVGAMVAAAAAVVVVVTQPASTVVDAHTPPLAGDAVIVARLAPAESVRVLAGPAFLGDVDDADPTAVVVRQHQGFAAYAFRAAAGEKLEVRLEGGTVVRAVGTLFYVDVDRTTGARRIGVTRGQVVVASAAGERAVASGERIVIDERGASIATSDAAPTAVALVDDPELVGFHDGPIARMNPGVSDAAADVADVDATSPPRVGSAVNATKHRGRTRNVAELLVDAEALVRSGKAKEARVLLARALRDPGQAPSHDVLKYEVARLDGFVLGAAETARPVLETLAQSARPQLRVQATLSLCELDLAVDKCLAKACLGRARMERGILGEEAARLEHRWSLRDKECER